VSRHCIIKAMMLRALPGPVEVLSIAVVTEVLSRAARHANHLAKLGDDLAQLARDG
jgi:hypothetical protein